MAFIMCDASVIDMDTCKALFDDDSGSGSSDSGSHSDHDSGSDFDSGAGPSGPGSEPFDPSQYSGGSGSNSHPSYPHEDSGSQRPPVLEKTHQVLVEAEDHLIIAIPAHHL